MKAHPSTYFSVKNSKIIVENGTLTIGMEKGKGIDSRKDNVRIHLKNATLHTSGNVVLVLGCRLLASGGKILIGDGTRIQPQVVISSNKRIEIGKSCLFATGVTIKDSDGHKIGYGGELPTHIIKDVVIKDHCWIGQHAMVLKGVTVGKGAVIAAGSIVTKDVKERTLVGGVPAQVLKENVLWEA